MRTCDEALQIMRRTHPSLSRKAGIDPKLVADQLGHGIGVSLDTYVIYGSGTATSRRQHSGTEPRIFIDKLIHFWIGGNTATGSR